MLACLPGPGDLSSPLLSYPQMNTGLRKWDTTQKMRAAQHPTPAELDAYAKKVANHPLTIKIFPNSVKVPQRKHVRRTVNGLDTSGQRYSPYPPSSSSSSASSSSSSLPQAATKTGLLAIVRPAAKGIVKDFDGTRTSSRLLAPSEAMMNPPPYAAPSTLSHHPQQSAVAAAALARHQQQQQHLHAQSMAHAVLQPQLPPPQHPGNHLLQPQQQQPPPPPPSLHGGGRKMSDADAPPNVTVSTSTIPLSMAATLQQSQPPDLSSIVHQINQFCQARAGSSATSVCEGQIANPSPISRNLLLSASTRVSAHSLPGPMPSCGVNPGGEHPAIPLGRAGPPSAYQNEMKQAAVAAAWNHHQLAHLQQMCGGGGETMIGPAGLMGKPPVAREQGFGGKAPGGYPLELCMGQPFNVKPPREKPTPSPPVNGLPYANGHYFPPLWNNILPTPNSDSSGSQDLAMPFHGAAGPQAMGAGAASAMECPAGPHYRAPPNGGGGNNNGGMPAMEYLSSGDFQHHPCLREPAPPPAGGMALGKAGRSNVNRAPGELADSRSLHIQHPGYR